MRFLHRIAWLAAVLGALTAPLTAQTTNLQLLGITVEGCRRTDPGLVVATSGLVVGETLTGDKVQNSLRQIWKLQLFSDIKLVVVKQTAEGVFLAVRVVELPRLEAVNISGGKKLGKEDVQKEIPLVKGQVVRPSDPTRIRRNLKRLADTKGFLLADIDVTTKPGSDSSWVTLEVNIREGGKVKIKDIQISGNQAFSDRKLRRQLKDTKRKSWFRSGEFKREKYREDLDKLVAFYREHGYRDAQVTGDSIWYSDDLRRMFLRINLDEGRKYYFGKVTFTGTDLFTDDELRGQLLFKPGDVFNQKAYEATLRERLIMMFYNRGYINAGIEPRETPAGGDTLDIEYHIQPGNRFSVNNINFTGNTKTLEKVIRREFVLKPGDTFDASKLQRSIREVAILNYFQDVKFDVEEVSEDEINLWVKVEERATDQANVSAGYSERDGLIGAVGFSAPNLFGTGQQASVDWNFGYRYGSFSVSYTEPWFLDTETSVGGSFYNLRRRWADGFTERLIGGAVNVGRRLYWPDDYFRGNWSYRLERSHYTDLSTDLRNRIAAGTAQLDTLVRISSSITQTLNRDSRDFPEFPTTGSVYTLTTEVAGGPLSGNDQYHKHILSLDWYTALTPKVVVYNQFLFGYMDGFTNRPRDIPLLEYLYMGGSGLTLGTPLRGYDERTVGPSLPGSRTADGGRTQLKVTAELRLKLVDNPTIYTLMFADAGNTFRTFNQTDPFDLRRSVGLGIRLFMPMIGLIGLDYGYGMDPDASGRKPGWLPHFQFGRYF